tara:strand:- start:177 stop:383 length:207 start_codon:yes stop_codon:yes gene_type:complete
MSGKGFKNWFKNFVWEIGDVFVSLWYDFFRPIIFTPLKDWIDILKIAGGTFLVVFIFALIILFFRWLF